MRDKLIQIINKAFEHLYTGHLPDEEIADQILALIGGERCVWTQSFPDGAYYVAHDKKIPAELKISTFCPFCSKRIEVKDEQG